MQGYREATQTFGSGAEAGDQLAIPQINFRIVDS
jgi:hypothetical protein